jgi:hypothetical protein
LEACQRPRRRAKTSKLPVRGGFGLAAGLQISAAFVYYRYCETFE